MNDEPAPDLRAALQPFVWSTGDVDAVIQALAGPLQRLVEQAAEAARLRETVARVEALILQWETRDVRLSRRFAANELKRALDGTDG